jgi:formylmethanofuran dehydrogenase subunit C
MITLRPRGSFTVPLEAEVISPDVIAGQSLAQIGRLSVVQGNTQAPLEEFFTLEGEPDETIRLEGDFSGVKHIGAAMTRGRIEIRGNAGMHLGAGMRGGEIVVHGSVGDWVGAEMRGGLLRITGDAGHLLGAGYRGSEKGMRGGVIVVGGSVGNEAGCAMRRGLIAVGGGAGDFTGVMMIAGSIIVRGELGIRTGAGMKRGTIITYGGNGNPPALLPTFRFDCTYRPPWIEIYLRQLAPLGFALPGTLHGGAYQRYSGDLADLGKGEILSWTSA